MIQQIVYYSISDTIIDKKTITDILETSRVNNSKKNITGCLLYHDKVFLQLIEGEQEELNKLYEIIKEDKRHTNVTLIIKEDINKRMFPGWNMAFHEFDKNNSSLEKFVESIDFFSKSIPKKTEAIDLFWRMAKQIVVK